MTTRTEPWPPGVPCWADLAAADVQAAADFYADVLGWTIGDGDPAYGGYRMAFQKGAAAAGMAPVQPDGHPGWTLYFSSADVDATADAVRSHGGEVIVEPADVGALGRMIAASDPSGAVFGVWQAGEHIGAGIVNEPGGLTWEDLRSTDPAAAKTFYASVFGYEFDPLPTAGDDYDMFKLPGSDPVGGMGGMMGLDGMPSHWVVYFGVADTDAAVARAEAKGGRAVVAPFDTEFGRMAALSDPGGTVFFLAQAPDSGWAQTDTASG